MAVSTVLRSGLSTFDKFQRTSAGASSTPGLFVAAGNSSIVTSPDGITWTTRTSGGSGIGLVDRDPISGTWSTFTNNGSAPGGGNWFSADGSTWTQQFSPPNQRSGRNGLFTEDRQFVDFDTSNRWQRIGNVQLFGGASGSAVVGDKGSAFRNRYIYSANFGGDVFTSVNGGASWLIDDGSITNATQVWATDTQFLVSNSTAILSSANGGTFTSRATAGFTVSGFRRANGLIFAYNFGSASTAVMTSPDGITWTTRTIPNMIVRDISYGAGNWVLVGYNSGGSAGAIATSPDGITWTARTTTASGLEGVLFA
jgi:hypothetical protein